MSFGIEDDRNAEEALRKRSSLSFRQGPRQAVARYTHRIHRQAERDPAILPKSLHLSPFLQTMQPSVYHLADRRPTFSAYDREIAFQDWGIRGIRMRWRTMS
jgi:hypothetical protein